MTDSAPAPLLPFTAVSSTAPCILLLFLISTPFVLYHGLVQQLLLYFVLLYSPHS